MAKGIRTLTPRDLAAIMNDPVSLELRDDLPELIPGLSATTFVTLARTLTKEQRLELLQDVVELLDDAVVIEQVACLDAAERLAPPERRARRSAQRVR